MWPEPCSGLELEFGVDADEGEFAWDFGTDAPGDTSSVQAPSHAYTEPGIYSVSLVYDLGGCADSLSQDIAVSPPYSPDFALGDITCTADAWSQPLTFTGDDPESGSLTWLVDGEQVATGTSPDAVVIPPGNHVVSTVLVNPYGCTSEAEQGTPYPALPSAAFEMSEPPCNGLEIAFSNLSTGADGFAWTFDVNAPGRGMSLRAPSRTPAGPMTDSPRTPRN